MFSLFISHLKVPHLRLNCSWFYFVIAMAVLITAHLVAGVCVGVCARSHSIPSPHLCAPAPTLGPAHNLRK